MVRNLYDQLEVDTSFQVLQTLSHQLPEPFVLLGGWAVFLTVNDRFEEENGQKYLGSRDVDLGFHVDPEWSIEELGNCVFARAQTILEEIGYIPMGTSRFCKIIHRETGRTISEDKAKNIPQYDLFYLYVDPIVDNIHSRHNEIFKIKPIDEPFLAGVFEEDIFSDLDIMDSKILLPNPDTLIGTKLKSFPNRDKFDKKIKDACDIYSLLWYSSDDFNPLISLVKEKYPDLCKVSREVIDNDIANKASNHLGIEPKMFKEVIGQLT